MNKKSDEFSQRVWTPKQPVQHIFFDVDSTLSSIEGIDVLAKSNRVGAEVAATTEECMSRKGMNPKAYQDRLDLVKPTLSQIKKLSDMYIKQLTNGAREVITILHKLGKKAYIVSAGLKQALLGLGNYLSIPSERIFAVDVFFDAKGNYLHFDNKSLLAQREGKTKIIMQTCPLSDISFLAGDGLSELEAKRAVSRFVGFGGHCMRENVRAASEFYITNPQLFSLLPLMLTDNEVKKLNHQEYEHFTRGMTAIGKNLVKIQELGHV